MTGLSTLSKEAKLSRIEFTHHCFTDAEYRDAGLQVDGYDSAIAAIEQWRPPVGRLGWMTLALGIAAVALIASNLTAVGYAFGALAIITAYLRGYALLFRLKAHVAQGGKREVLRELDQDQLAELAAITERAPELSTFTALWLCEGRTLRLRDLAACRAYLNATRNDKRWTRMRERRTSVIRDHSDSQKT
jgi:hypothetical protein